MSDLSYQNKMAEYNQEELKTENHDLEIWLLYPITFPYGSCFCMWLAHFYCLFTYTLKVLKLKGNKVFGFQQIVSASDKWTAWYENVLQN